MDKQTYVDLEIFEGTDGSEGLFGLLNHTLTQGGKDVLKKRFLHPFTSEDEILKTQQAIRQLIPYTGQWRKVLNERMITNAEHYLFTGIMVFQSGKKLFKHIKAYRFRWKHPDYFYFIQSNIRCLLQLVQKLDSFLLPLQQSISTPYIKDLQKQVSLLLHCFAAHKEALKDTSPITSVLQLDFELRAKLNKEIELILEMIYELDALFSMACAGTEYRLIFPQITTKREGFFINQLRHISIKNGVANDLIMQDAHFAFITGPNMAGKTAFIKASAIAVFLAHMGMGIPATGACIYLVDEIFSSINIADNLHRGESFFQAEILRLTKLGEVLHKGKKVFAILDELFRGTNLKDAMDCTALIADLLIKRIEGIYLLTSHITELYNVLEKRQGVLFIFFESCIKNNKIQFSYKCNHGVSSERLGLMLLKKSSLPGLMANGNQNVKA